MSKFDELKKLAEAATPGPWEATRQTDDECSFIGYFIEGVGKTISDDGTAPDHKDALFIAAANPAAILELLAIKAQLVAALSKSKRYVSCAYECAFPDEEENAQVLSDIEAAISAAGAHP